jgi:hypothetical protein
MAFLILHNSVVDRHHFYNYPDPETFHFDADPDPNPDSDPTPSFIHDGKQNFRYPTGSTTLLH